MSGKAPLTLLHIKQSLHLLVFYQFQLVHEQGLQLLKYKQSSDPILKNYASSLQGGKVWGTGHRKHILATASQLHFSFDIHKLHFCGQRQHTKSSQTLTLSIKCLSE